MSEQSVFGQYMKRIRFLLAFAKKCNTLLHLFVFIDDNRNMSLLS